MSLPAPRLVLVTWLDAIREDGDLKPTLTRPIGLVRETAGWLLRRDADGVVIAMTRDYRMDEPEDPDFERGFFIPAAYVRSVRRLGST